MPRSGIKINISFNYNYENYILKRKTDACDPQDIDKFVEYHIVRGGNLTGILSKVTQAFSYSLL